MFKLLLRVNDYVLIKNALFIESNIRIMSKIKKRADHPLLNMNPNFFKKSILITTKINMYFYHLILKKWLFFNTQNRFYAVVYNYFVFKTLYQITFLISQFKKFNKNVLFITDSKIETLVSFRDINFLTLDKNFSAFIPFFSNAVFWSKESNELSNIYLLSQQVIYQKVDLAVILCEDYSAFNKKDILGISKFSMGLVDSNVNPHLFDYFIPVIKNKFISLQLFKELLSVKFLTKF